VAVVLADVVWRDCRADRVPLASRAKARALAGLKGLHRQPAGLPDGTPSSRASWLAPTTECSRSKESFRMFQERPAGPAGLPSHTRSHRSAPDHRVCRPGRQSPGRRPHRLVNQEVRPRRPPLPTIEIRPGPHIITARRPHPPWPPASPNQDPQRQPGCAL